MDLKCEDCPLQNAYAQYVIEHDIQPDEVNYEDIFSSLTIMDAKKLERLTEKDSTDAININDCPGPYKTFFGIGRKACAGNFTLRTEDRQII